MARFRTFGASQSILCRKRADYDRTFDRATAASYNEAGRKVRKKYKMYIFALDLVSDTC